MNSIRLNISEKIHREKFFLSIIFIKNRGAVLPEIIIAQLVKSSESGYYLLKANNLVENLYFLF
ncbi:hypothetical protein DRQ29_01090 [bacterium]|nr:MAG: hypothetical protein DRQ29_01090 [bacterium]